MMLLSTSMNCLSDSVTVVRKGSVSRSAAEGRVEPLPISFRMNARALLSLTSLKQSGSSPWGEERGEDSRSSP